MDFINNLTDDRVSELASDWVEFRLKTGKYSQTPMLVVADATIRCSETGLPIHKGDEYLLAYDMGYLPFSSKSIRYKKYKFEEISW